MNQLLWYYADLEKQKCLEDMKANVKPEEDIYVGGKRSSKVSNSNSDNVPCLQGVPKQRVQ